MRALHSDQAAAIADGLERRRRSVTVPAAGDPSLLRGVAGPIGDARLARDVAVRRALVQLKTR